MRAVIEFITVEKVTPTEINRLLRAVYLDDVVDRSTVISWDKNFVVARYAADMPIMLPTAIIVKSSTV